MAATKHAFGRRVVIGGLPRAGTTMLRLMLDRTGELIAGPETALFLRPLADQRDRGPRFSGRLANRLQLDVATVERALTEGTSSIDACDRLMASYARSVGRAPIGWAEKTPRNCFSYTWLAEQDPSVLFVSMVRDGLDVVTSRDPRPNAPEEYYCSVQRYCDTMSAVLGFRSDRHRVVRYEDLVAHPESQLRDLLGWLGVTFRPEVVASSGSRTGTQRTSEHVSAKVVEPVQSTWIGRWRAPEHEARIAEFFAHREAPRWRTAAGYSSP